MVAITDIEAAHGHIEPALVTVVTAGYQFLDDCVSLCLFVLYLDDCRHFENAYSRDM